MRIWPLLALLPFLLGAADPRPRLVQLQLEQQDASALDHLEQMAALEPQQSPVWGLDYLRGHLLERLDRPAEAAAAFDSALLASPSLAQHSTLRLADNHYRSGDLEQAAELLAALLQQRPDASLRPRIISLLLRVVSDGGSCDLLELPADWSVGRELWRQVEVARIECELNAGRLDRSTAASRWSDLLRQDREDEPARRAALGLMTLAAEDLPAETRLLIGLCLHHHRDFADAIPFLESSLGEPRSSVRGIDRSDVLYTLARSHYWLGQYDPAAEWFARAAADASSPAETARALFQRGRSQELAGDWENAVEAYEEVWSTEPNDSWAAAARLAAMRLQWRQGREETALEILQPLRQHRSGRTSLERAALFLASSQIVRSRFALVDEYLSLARQARRGDGAEIHYWQGRWAELSGRPAAAIESYLSLLVEDSFHPLAQSAAARLRAPALDEQSRRLGAELALSDRSSDLLRANLLLPEGDAEQATIAEELRNRWLQSNRLRATLQLEPAPLPAWNLWQSAARLPDDELLALGVIETVSRSFRNAFPLQDSSLALAGSSLLSANGFHRSSLQTVEIIAQRLARDVPARYLPASYRRLLYPRPYEYDIVHQSSRFGIEPELLLAIIREESRFDPDAISSASARGLTQFVLPTAERLADKLGLEAFVATDLHRPEVAILLGAAYLAELQRRFDGNLVQVVAAYNAGEDAARLWQSYCFSRQPEELLTKVGYRQTRSYIEKVMASRAQYREIYGSTAAPPDSPPIVITAGGRSSN